MKKLLFTLCFICALNSVNADVLYFNQGEEHSGSLISIDGDNILFQRLNDPKPEKFNIKEIAHILISKNRLGDDIETVDKITDKIALNVLKNLPNPADYHDSDYITLYRQMSYEYISETEIISRTREITQILKEPGLDCANQSFYYNADNTDCQIEFAHTYAPDGKVYHLTDDALSNESLYTNTPEYSKLKKIKMAMKKVDLGSIIDYSVVRRIKNIGPLNPKAFKNTFGEREPVLQEEMTFTFPEKLKFNKLELQWENNVPIFTEKTENGKITWNWSFSDKKGFIAEQNMLPINRIFPRVVIYNEYDKSQTAELLAKAYKESAPDKQTLENFMARIDFKPSDTNYEKVCKIYNFLNKELTTVGMDPDDMGSFKPVSGNITINKKYANSQAWHALMYNMLKQIDVESYVGFTSNKREKVTYGNHPNLYFAPSPILKIVLDGKSYYTDGGSIYTPFSVIPVSMQGSEATFIDIEKSKMFSEQLPVQTYKWNTNEEIIHVKILEDGTMDVNSTTISRGPFEERIRGLKSIKEKEQSNYAERRVKAVHPNAVLKSYGFTDMGDLDTPAVYNISYTIPQAAQKASDKIMSFTNFWIRYGSGSASLKKRKYPMKYWATESTSKTIIFDLPEGFNWVKWDKQYKFSTSDIAFNSNITQNNRQIIYADHFQCNSDEFLDDKAYQNYRQCILTMSELANQWIIIEK